MSHKCFVSELSSLYFEGGVFFPCILNSNAPMKDNNAIKVILFSSCVLTQALFVQIQTTALG